MNSRLWIAGLVALVGLATPSFADIYRWRDADGVIRFSNQPPPAGVKILDRIEEMPYDAESDRQRMEEDRRMRLEFEKLDLEQRQAAVAAREREAQLKLEEAERRLEQSRQKLERAEECDEGYYLRYGECVPGAVYYRRSGPALPRDPYRGIHREKSHPYFKAPSRRPGIEAPKPPGGKLSPAAPPRTKPAEAKLAPKSGKAAAAAGELEQPAQTAPEPPAAKK
ncbi:MAG: DUF4124 domain-containing protein [Desulfobacterales bacterium]